MSGRPSEFSIVMPLYNKEREVGRAVRSVLGQSVADFELVVVDDGSTDRGASIVREFDDPRIFLLAQPNSGVAAARNAGIRAAHSDWIAFLDADDEWQPDFLETISRLHRLYPNSEILATRYFVGSVDGRLRKAIVRGLPVDSGSDWAGLLPDYFLIAALSEPPVCSSAVCVRRTAVESVGLFPEGVTAGEDLLTWARLAVRGSVAYSACPRAIFWTPTDLSMRTSRMPQEPDRVGIGLAELLETVSPLQRASLLQYISHWHKMRSVVLSRFGEHARARREIATACRYSRADYRVVLFRLLLLGPPWMVESVCRMITLAGNRRCLRMYREGSR